MSFWKNYKNFDELYFDNRWKFPFRQLHDIKWWILHRFHPKHRYHVLKFRDLEPGWCDVDGRMLHACFDLLCDYAEKEDPGFAGLKYQWTYRRDQEEAPDHICTEVDIASAKHIYDEAVYLYEWWKSTLPLRKSGDYDSVDGRDAAVDDDNLIRLIKIRRYLWT